MNRNAWRHAIFAVALSALALPVAGQELGGCPLFPRNNIWNVPVDHLPVHTNSAKFIESGGIERNLHPDFSANGGIPFNIVPANQPKVNIVFTSPESDPGPYPIPADAVVEPGNGDNHLLVLQQGECKLYEVFLAQRLPDGSWKAESGAIYDLRANLLRPDGWTSADAAGLPILSGLVRFDEIQAGEIRHAIRVTVPRTKREYVWPARHFASRNDDAALPPMGQRFRLKASFDISKHPPQVQVLLRALKKYGMMLSDNGSSWFLTGVQDRRWDDEMWATIKTIKGSELEAVDVSPLMISPNSAQAGTVLTAGRNDVPFSATPSFDATGGTTLSITLQGSVSSSTVANVTDGVAVSFLICQNEQGGHSFTWPANVRGGMLVGTAPNTCSAQQFVSDGKNLYATSAGVADQPRQ